MKPKKQKTPLLDIVWPANRFVERDLPPRPWMVEGCIPHPSIGMLYAWRGSGKTLVAMDLALNVARGAPWLGYKVEEPKAVLYIDGEMPAPDLKARMVAQSGAIGPPANLFILASEDLAVEHRNINLANEDDRMEVARLIVEIEREYSLKIGLVILDNWTTLVRGLDENDNSQLDALKEWFVLLRHGEKSLLIVHHAGKAGGQRGGSAREDVLDYSIKLTGNDGPEHFQWDKTRTGRPDPDAFSMKLLLHDTAARDGGKYISLVRTKVSSKGPEPKHDDAILDFLKEKGASTHSDICEALELDKKTVTRALNRLCKLQRVSWLAGGKYCHG